MCILHQETQVTKTEYIKKTLLSVVAQWILEAVINSEGNLGDILPPPPPQGSNTFYHQSFKIPSWRKISEFNVV